MYLVATNGNRAGQTMEEHLMDERGNERYGGLAMLVPRAVRWWKQRCLRDRRRAAKRQLFLVETLVLGPKQRVFLMKCGEERFLVGTGSDGVSSIVRTEQTGSAVGQPVEPSSVPPVVLHGGERWA